MRRERDAHKGHKWKLEKCGASRHRHYCCAAASSFALSNFVICIIACMAFGCRRSSRMFSGTTCQHTPNLSLSQPQAISLPPPLVNTDQ